MAVLDVSVGHTSLAPGCSLCVVPSRGSCPAVPSHSALCSSGHHPVPAFPACWGSEASQGALEAFLSVLQGCSPSEPAEGAGLGACLGLLPSRGCGWPWEQLQAGALAVAPPAARNRSSPLCREVPAVWESPAGAWPMQGGGTGAHPRAKAAGAEPKGRTCWQDLVWCSMKGSSSPQSKNLSSQGASSAMG